MTRQYNYSFEQKAKIASRKAVKEKEKEIQRLRKNLLNHFKTKNKKFLKDSSIMLTNLFQSNKFKNLING